VTEQEFATDEQRWQAVQARSPRADGAFVLAVTTTGIYCRPSCPARRPRREHVLFFESGVQAEAAGFRACKRCRPNGTAPREEQREAIAQACRSIEAAAEPPALDTLAAAAGLSPSHFHRLFKSIVGVTPKEYGVAVRDRRVKEELERGASVTEAIYGAGYNASSRFYEGAAGRLGMTAGEYKNGAPGVQVRFALGESSLGKVMVAVTERGVCAIQLGASRPDLVDALRARFPHADVREDDTGFAGWVAQVVAFVETPGRGLDLPLDIQGTAFQQRVWKALQQIPVGETRTYAEIARQVGSPAAARAVGQACGANRIALAIPCHRAVAAGGGLGGYHWGVMRKQELLRRERELAPD
jgi:AraC family transcriptional regulator, regulatory protein of adaptative response / methylated-DNA-[protein]-cysteine methyltransferase